jgi:hypothetical protein
MTESSALVPSMTWSVRRCLRVSNAAVAGLKVYQEAKELAAGRVEGTLHGFGLVMGEQRAAVIADEVENDLLDRPPAEVTVYLLLADDLTAKSPDVVAVLAQGLTRQMPDQQVAPERLEAFLRMECRAPHTPSCGATDRDPDSRSARDRQRPVARAGCHASWQLLWVLLPCG